MEYVSLDDLKPGMEVGADVLAFFSGHLTLLKKGEVLTEHFIARLRMFDVQGVYINLGHPEDKMEYGLRLPAQKRKRAIETVGNLFEEIHTMKDSGASHHIQAVRLVVDDLVNAIHSHRDVLVNISDLKSYDDYTYHHSVSVSLLSLAVGYYMDMPKMMLCRLGLSSILHDIGKMMVPLEIINKPGRLTEEEFAIIREHPSLGAQYIRKSDIEGEDIVRGVLEHHEKVDGTGYPAGLSQRDISLFGRIISVVDVYDALTSRRPYRDSMLPSEAVEYLMGNAGAAFDLEVVRAFIKKVEFYPVGTYVQLSDGNIGTVINNENPLRPIVRTMEKQSRLLDLFQDKKCHKITITGCFQQLPASVKDKPGGAADDLNENRG